MLAMAISPWTAVMVGIGSGLGFLITLGRSSPPALVHAVFGGWGRTSPAGAPLWRAILLTLPIHVIGEALVVIPFGFDLYQALVVVGIGTGLHHLADGFITAALYGVLNKAGVSLALRPHTVTR